MKLLPKIIFLSIALALSSCCNQEQTPQERMAAQERKRQADALFATKDIQKYLWYVQDPRTGLCFAASRISNDKWYVYSPVECTDKVIQNLINPLR